MKFLQNKLLRFVLAHLAALAAIVVTRLLLRPFQPFLGIQIIALLYLLPVMASTVLWGLTPGVLAAFMAFLTFNYYSIEPYHTLAVRQTQDFITLIVLLITAVVMSQLIGQARRGVQLAKSREWEATHMYELISSLSGLQDEESIARTIAAHTRETFRFERVAVALAGPVGQEGRTILAPNGSLPAAPQDSRIPLATARGREGELQVWLDRPPLTEQESRLLETYASQGALSLERIRLGRADQKARVLEESDRLKSSLLSSVSHELRSPLAAIKASVSSLRLGKVDWNIAARQELLATIEEETDHLNLLVGNLLDMSRIESRALHPVRRWNSIGEIIIGVVTRMRRKMGNHQVEMDLPVDLPLVPTDYMMMEQVFTNLLSNSSKYAPEGTTINISAKKEDAHLHIELANEGPQVAEADLDRIFDKFYRVTAADRVTGTGLGLSICKGFVEAHGGKIWAENRPGQFVFHILLPLMLDGVPPVIPEEAGVG